MIREQSSVSSRQIADVVFSFCGAFLALKLPVRCVLLRKENFTGPGYGQTESAQQQNGTEGGTTDSVVRTDVAPLDEEPRFATFTILVAPAS